MSRTAETTHKIMSSIKSKDTKPELAIRQALWHDGLRYRVNCRGLPGKPDIVFTRARIVVFCDGDYWHGHNWAVRGLSSLDEELQQYSDYWQQKIKGNVTRDKVNTESLEASGWLVIRLWESDIKKHLDDCVEIIENAYYQRISSLKKFSHETT